MSEEELVEQRLNQSQAMGSWRRPPAMPAGLNVWLTTSVSVSGEIMGSGNRPLSLQASISTESIYAIWQKLISHGVSLDLLYFFLLLFLRSEPNVLCVRTSQPEQFLGFCFQDLKTMHCHGSAQMFIAHKNANDAKLSH